MGFGPPLSGGGAQGPQGPQGVAGSSGGSSAPNNTTNPSFVGSGQTPTDAGAIAANGQTSTATFGTIAIIFTVTLVTQGQYILCTTNFGSSQISALDDPGGLFADSPSGPGMYISKSANSGTVSFKNVTGISTQILVQGVNTPVTSATVWA